MKLINTLAKEGHSGASPEFRQFELREYLRLSSQLLKLEERAMSKRIFVLSWVLFGNLFSVVDQCKDDEGWGK